MKYLYIDMERAEWHNNCTYQSDKPPTKDDLVNAEEGSLIILRVTGETVERLNTYGHKAENWIAVDPYPEQTQCGCGVDGVCADCEES